MLMCDSRNSAAVDEKSTTIDAHSALKYAISPA